MMRLRRSAVAEGEMRVSKAARGAVRVVPGSWVVWVIFGSICCGFGWVVVHRAPAPTHRHTFGSPMKKKRSHSSLHGEAVFVEIACGTAGSTYLYDLDGEARCTADATVARSTRAWERRVVDEDLGWFILVSAGSRRALAVADSGRGVTVAEAAALDDDAASGRQQWRFEHVPGAEAGHARRLRHRSDGTYVHVRDVDSRRGVVVALAGPFYNEAASVFTPIPLPRAVFDASVRAAQDAARRDAAEDEAAKHELRRLFAVKNGGASSSFFFSGGLRGRRATDHANQERRVISIALYGSEPKYNLGAIRNADLVDDYFPGWTLRVYADGESVPEATLDELRRRGADVRVMRKKKGAASSAKKKTSSSSSSSSSSLASGAIAGMFWRFLVADDPEVDRFIVRDSDSRLNARDAFAVAEWIRSGASAHTIRDHPNHARPLNGGLWGATRASSVHGRMRHLAARFENHDTYGADLDFLALVIYPLVRGDLLAHDAYSCDSFPNSTSFPTPRTRDFQHVGQVFDVLDGADRPRMDDIDSYTRGLRVPYNCRRRPDWIYG